MNGDQPHAFRFRVVGQLSANGPTPLLWFGQLPTFSPSLCLRAQCRSHQSLVVFGHPALPHAYVAANPSSTKMSPTSRPFVLTRISHTKKAHRGAESAKLFCENDF